MSDEWMLEKEFRFEAAHRLPNHDGKCQRLHGHSWRGIVRVSGAALTDEGAKAGMLVDYGVIKEAIDPLVNDYLDHHYLNETTHLDSPTSEHLARWVYRRLAERLSALVSAWPSTARLHSVTIEETCTARCTYWDAP